MESLGERFLKGSGLEVVKMYLMHSHNTVGTQQPTGQRAPAVLNMMILSTESGDCTFQSSLCGVQGTASTATSEISPSLRPHLLREGSHFTVESIRQGRHTVG